MELVTVIVCRLFISAEPKSGDEKHETTDENVIKRFLHRLRYRITFELPLVEKLVLESMEEIS